MTTIQHLCEYLEAVAPSRLAEAWDNVGFLLGDARHRAERVMTCLTVTPASCGEAIGKRADLIITHHPLPFRPFNRFTTETTAGRLLWQLASQGVAIYSPHTSWDSAQTGINQQLAQGLGLSDVRPLQPIPGDPDGLGSGRIGRWSSAMTLAEAIQRVKRFLSLAHLQFVGQLTEPVERVAVACGSAGQFLRAAHESRCQLLLTGETSFHTCLEAEALGMNVILAGHFASERFSLDHLAERLKADFPQLEIWASDQEKDPLQWV